MHFSIKNLIDLKEKVNKKISELNFKNYSPKIIAVSKTFSLGNIQPLIDYGHLDYGENKVQEAVEKWSEIKQKNQNINLHMIGKLQTNKVKLAVKLFDFIHSVDSIKLAKKISDEQTKIKKKVKIFLQVNIGNETQKSGTNVNEVSILYDECIKLNLEVLGLMCIPPIDEPVTNNFLKIKNKNDELKLSYLSLGMSGDYAEAIEVKSNYLRIGTKIFGNRN